MARYRKNYLKDPYFRELSSLYGQLHDTELVKNRDASNRAIERFEDILNRVLPKNREEALISDTIRELYKCERNAFRNYIFNSKKYFLFLLTDGGSISKSFRVYDIVYIRWARGKYIVSRKEQFRKDPRDECQEERKESRDECQEEHKD